MSENTLRDPAASSPNVVISGEAGGLANATIRLFTEICANHLYSNAVILVDAAPLARRGAHLAPKDSGKMRLVRKSTSNRDLGEGFAAHEHLLSGSLNAPAHDEGVRAFLKSPLECTREVAVAQPDQFGQFTERQWLVKICVNVVCYAFGLPWDERRLSRRICCRRLPAVDVLLQKHDGLSKQVSSRLFVAIERIGRLGNQFRQERGENGFRGLRTPHRYIPANRAGHE